MNAKGSVMNKIWAICSTFFLVFFSASALLNPPKFHPLKIQTFSQQPGFAKRAKSLQLMTHPVQSTIVQQPVTIPQVVVELSSPAAGLDTIVVVSIRVDNVVQPLSAFQLDLVYPPNILAFESAQQGAFPGSTGNLVVCPVEAFPASDRLRKACAAAGASTGPTGSGILAEVSMRVIGTGEADLTLENAFLVNQAVPPEKILVSVVPATLLAGVDAGLAITGTQAQSAAPGAEVLYTLVLTNTGTYTDSFTLSAQSNWGTDRLEPEQTGLLAPGGTIGVNLWVEVPDSASNLQQNITTVTGVSQIDPGISAQFQVVTTVEREEFLIFLPLILR